MQYFSYGTCSDNTVGIAATITMDRDLQNAKLVRKDCEDLAQPQSISASQLSFALQDSSVLVFNGQVFDQQTGFAEQRITTEFCQSTGVSPTAQTVIWSDQGVTSSLFGSVSLGDGTGSGDLIVQNPSTSAPLDFVTATGQASQFELALTSTAGGSLTYTLAGGSSVSVPTVTCSNQVVPTNAIFFRSRSATYSSASSSLTIDTPAGVQSGDVMIAQVWGDFSSSCTDAILPPAGWTQIRSDSFYDYGCDEQYFFYKVAGASEPASYTFTLQSTPSYFGYFGAAVVAYSGVDTSTPVDAHACNHGTSATATAPSITTASGNDMLIFTIYQNQTHGALPTTPTYLTQRIGDTDNSSYFNYVYDGTVTSAGATASIVESVASGDDWMACQIALKPAP